jgi:ABC-type Fe3+ transport system permease subunit
MILLRESGVLPHVLVLLGLTQAPVELLYHDATILVGLVYTSLLFMIVPLVSALESLDDSLIEAAYDLGGNGWSIFRHIVVLHAAPGIAAGSIVVFMLTLGNYLTPRCSAAEFAVVHRADLHAVHHALQLGARRGVRLPAARAVDGDRLDRPDRQRPAPRRRDEARVIPSLPRSALSRFASSAYVALFLVFLFVPLAVVAVFAFNDANYPAPPWRGFTLDWFLGGHGRTGLFTDVALLRSVGTRAPSSRWR